MKKKTKKLQFYAKELVKFHRSELYISGKSEGLDCLGQRCLKNLTAQHVPRLWRDAGISCLQPEVLQEQEALCFVSLLSLTESLRLSLQIR